MSKTARRAAQIAPKNARKALQNAPKSDSKPRSLMMEIVTTMTMTGMAVKLQP
jgi:hypothetical protein